MRVSVTRLEQTPPYEVVVGAEELPYVVGFWSSGQKRYVCNSAFLKRTDAEPHIRRQLHEPGRPGQYLLLDRRDERAWVFTKTESKKPLNTECAGRSLVQVLNAMPCSNKHCVDCEPHRHFWKRV